MSDIFCKTLTNAVSFKLEGNSTTLTFNPCCEYKKHIPYTNKVNFYKERLSFSKIKNFIPECSSCETNEKVGKTSRRNITNGYFPDNLKWFNTHKLEISLDTTCNAACIQCGNQQSSLWRKENGIKNHIQDDLVIDNSINEITKLVDIKNIKEFFFWGGEPLLTDTHLKILKQVKNFDDITLMYTTNGSIVPNEEVIEIWKKVKRLRLNFSLDGIQQRFHYMRWPLHWEKINQNLEMISNFNLLNLKCKINYCLTPLNSFYIDEIEAWKNSNQFTKKLFLENDYLNLIRTYGNLDLEFTPENLRNKILQKYGNDHVVSKMISECKIRENTHMINYLNFWDQKRKMSWRSTFNEVEKYF